MYKSLYTGLSCSPQYGSFAFGSNPGPSDLDNLISGRERKISDFVDQAIFECLLGGDINIALSSSGEYFRSNFSALSKNAISSFLIGQGGLKSDNQRCR